MLNRFREEIIRLIKYATPRLIFAFRELQSFLLPRWKRILFVSSFSGFIFLVLLFGGVYIQYSIDRSSIASALSNYKLWMEGRGTYTEKPPIRILGTGGNLLGEYLPEKISRIPLKNCREMKWLNAATVSAEDRNFYEHKGVSFRGIFRAMIRNILALNIREGAGTITQQLGRNLFTDRKTFALIRKVYETYSAFQIEDLYSKEEILCLYLNKIYMGEGRIGAEEASWFYFRKPPWQLNPAEAAMIVGLFPSPARYSPLNNIRVALLKQELVLDFLVRDKQITEKQKKKYFAEFKILYNVVLTEKEANPGTVGLYGASRYFRINTAPDVNEYAIEFLKSIIPEEEMNEGGLQIFTTIEPVRQSAALSAIRSQVEKIRSDFRKKSGFPPKETKDMEAGLNGVLVSIDAHNGNIRAAVGGYAINDSGGQVNRIMSMKRQPGSALKGFLYAAAIEEGIVTKDSMVKDEPISINGYAPRNWYKGHKGEITLRYAIAQSTNTVAVKTLNQLGIRKFKSYIDNALNQDFLENINRFPNNLTLALGSGELTPLELATLYAPVLNNGLSVSPRLILSVKNREGEVLWESGDPAPGSQVFSLKTAHDVVYLLESVVEEEGTAEWISKKRAKSSSFLPFPIAGKSGTVQIEQSIRKKYRDMNGVHDVWFVGLVPGEVTVVWLGHDAGAPFPGSGAGNGGSVWANYAQNSLKGKVPNSFFSETVEQNSQEVISPDAEFNPDGSIRRNDVPTGVDKGDHEPIVIPVEKPKG